MKLYITTLLISASILTGLSQSSLQKAEMQFDMRDYSLAISSFEQVLADQPENLIIPARIANCYVQLQDYLKASQWYAKIADNDDVTLETLVAYGDVLKSLRLYAKAKFYYQKIGSFNPELATYLVHSCDVARIEMNGDPYYEITTMSVNSRSTDFAPYILNDDLVFSSLRQDITFEQPRKTKNGKTTLNSENAIFVSQNHGSKEIKHLENSVQGEEVISQVKYSEDGKWVAFQKSDFREGQRLFDNRPGKMSIYLAKVSSNGQWTDVKPFEHNGNEYSTGYPSFTPDGSVLYFASTRPGGSGGWDLYVSFRSTNGWTIPQNMGGVVNTTGDEIAPYYTDHKLFFSSNRHTGIGGFDIFKASSEEGQWINVRSMGYPLNSPKDDIDFVWDPVQNMGYFSSNRIGSTGGYDIYSCSPLYEEIIMTVMDQQGEHPVQGAIISSVGAKSAPVQTDQHGKVIIHQRFNETSRLVISHDDYKSLDMTLKAPGEGPAKYDVYIDKSLAKDKLNDKEIEKTVAKSTQPQPGASKNIVESTSAKLATEGAVTSKTVVVGKPTTTQSSSSETENVAIVKTDAKTTVTTSTVSAESSSAKSTSTVTDEKEVAAPVARPNRGKYAVQIAAVGKSTSLDAYSSLTSIGKVMQYPENGLYKIRVGYYDNEAQVNNALRSIKKSGYPDAFIVKARPDNSTPVDALDLGQNETISSEDYMVRLGTYSRPEFFDASKVENLGTVDTFKSGKYTIMLLRGYKNYDAADYARRESVKQGFKDAYIVVEKNGGLHKASR